MKDGIYVYVSQDVRTQSSFIWILRDIQEGSQTYVPVQITEGVGEWGWSEPFEEGTSPPPSFVIPGIFRRFGVIQELVDKLCEEFGVKPTGVPESETELKATKHHLRDLQQLLFKYDWVELQRGEPIKPSTNERIIEREVGGKDGT